ncbi:MAG: hypothetical protein HY208_04615 [Nitrospirae bacterium]|nr:hypothetical protein [Nitrospirota bacterium]
MIATLPTEGALGGEYAGRVMRIVALPFLLLFCSCAPLAHSVVVSEDVNVDWEKTGRRYICLTREDAQRNGAILSLNTKKAVEKYERSRVEHPRQTGPIEAVLYPLIHGDDHGTAQALHKNWDRLPDYLRLMLQADLSREGLGEEEARPDELLRMYRAALDAQTCALNRELMEFRIRQLKYRQ